MELPSSRIGPLVRDAIRDSGVSISEVARAVGMTRPTLHRRLSGEDPRGLSLDELYQVCRRIGVRAHPFVAVLDDDLAGDLEAKSA